MVLQTNACIKELDACLMQQGKPVYFTSKALTETQKGYVAIKLECLAVVWSMEKFHHFLYGTHFILDTDQKPLEAILSKSLNQATPQLHRILIQTFPYHFTVHHILGPTNQLANCLCRLGTQNNNNKLPKLHIYQITSQLKARVILKSTPYSNTRRCQPNIIETHHHQWMAYLHKRGTS